MTNIMTSTPVPETVFIVTPESKATETVASDSETKRGKVKFVTLKPGYVITTNVENDNEIMTLSSQHVQKVTKAPAQIPENFLTTVVSNSLPKNE